MNHIKEMNRAIKMSQRARIVPQLYHAWGAFVAAIILFATGWALGFVQGFFIGVYENW